MFSKKSPGDLKKSSQKVLEHKKDVVTRLKHLRILLDNYRAIQLRSYFEINFSQIFFVFYENFSLVETGLRQKVTKAQREDLENVLYVLERIIVYLPDLIHVRWQFNSIGRILKKLLHVGNCLKVRLDGMRLFLLWFQVLQNNSSHECYLIYATLVPNFPPPEELQGTSLEGVMVQGSKVISNSEVPVEETEVQPIIPQQPGEKQPENLTKVMLESLLRYSVAESLMIHRVCRMEWDNDRRSENAFIFLLTCFKRFYLPTIFPEFDTSTSLYKSFHGIPDLTIPHSLKDRQDGMVSALVASCKVSVIQWVVSFITTKKNRKPAFRHKNDTKTDDEEEDEEEEGAEERQDSREDSLERHLDVSYKDENSLNATLTNSDQSQELDFQGVAEKELVDAARAMVVTVFYSSRLNVNFVVEVLRQGFLLPMSEATAVRKALKVYKDWIQPPTDEEKPRFMSEPSLQEPPPPSDTNTSRESLPPRQAPSEGTKDSISIERDDKEAANALLEANKDLGVTDVDSPPLPQPDKTFDNLEFQENEVQEGDQLEENSNEDISSATTATVSFSDEIKQSLQQEFDKCNVEAGMQATTKVFITHSAHVFLYEPLGQEERQVREQVSICEAVLNMYKNIVMKVTMNKDTWEQLLKVLLKITQGVLEGEPSEGRLSLGKQLASSLFKTLIITWIKANLEIQVSVELWDDFLHVLSSLTHWEELIKEWAKTMDTLTKMLAKKVYGLDLSNLPLDKLEEKRKKRLLGSKTEKREQKPHPRSFSTGWGRSDSTSPQEDMRRLRIESANLDSHIETTEDDGTATIKLKDLAKLVENGSETDLYPTLTRQRSMTVDPAYGNSVMRTAQLIGEQSEALHSSFPTLRGQRSSTEDPGGGINAEENSAVNLQFMRSSSAGDILEAVSFIKDEPKHEPAQKTLPKSTTFPPVNRESVQSQADPPKDPLPKSTTFPPSHQNEVPLTVTDAAPLLDDNHSVDTPDLHGLQPPDGISLESSLSVHTADSHLSTSMDSNSITPSTFLEDLSADLSPTVLPYFIHSEPSTPSQALSLEGEMGSLQEAQIEESAEVFYRTELSVVSGGTKLGWSSDSAVIIWRRMLGALGDINKIKNPGHHAQVMKCLWDLWQQLAKLRDNLGISTNNLFTPPPPDYIPPLQLISPWLFKATQLPNVHQSGRLWAYRLLCFLTIRRQDQPLSKDYLTHFYRLLHVGLNNSEQDVVNTIVQYSAPEFFSCDLPGSTMLILDFIHAANIITNSTDMEAPRISALSLLGSLVCFPNMFCNLNLLEPNSPDIVCIKGPDMSPVKDLLLGILLKCGKKEPNSEARCIALCSLSIFLYEELVHATFHSRMKDALNVLLVSLKFSSKQVAQMACDMLLMLSDQAGRLRTHLPETPKKIIEVIAITASTLLPQAHATGDKKLLVSLLFCLLEWCMAVPVNSLLEKTQSNSKQEGDILIHTVFRVLQSASEERTSQPRWSTNLAELASPDYDPHLNLDAIKESRRSLFIEGTTSGPESFMPGTPIQSRAGLSTNVVALTANTVLCHLMNRLNHFPLEGGPACVTSTLNEFDDHLNMDELSPAIFEAPNVQFFIYNDSSIVSLVQLSSQDTLSDDARLLASAQSELRIIIRNVGGKFSWDGGILYGPSERSIGPQKPEDQEVESYDASLEESADVDEDEDEFSSRMASSLADSATDLRGLSRPRSTLPSWDADREADLLDELQQFLGYTSPECLLRPGVPLNIPTPAPAEISTPLEKEALAGILHQFELETKFCSENAERKSMISQPMQETPPIDPDSSFFLCRSLLSQLGLLNWNKRSQVDILKKNDQLARELKNLDSRQCRETHKIAVMYVAEGQEDKMSVLSNSAGSKAYENFVSGIGWEIDLATHTGFMGGLQKNHSTGETTPYWATSSVEVIFHVSTRMPSGSEDHNNKKMRHLGNDEVHIVWSEHNRDYRRGIIATEFGDVIIVIYPLKNKLFRIQIQMKPGVPFFGPLFDGAIVDHIVLPGLVRATAINASRGKRLQIPYYQRFYEERARYVETIIKNHKKPSSFEQFAANVFEPSVANKPLARTKPGLPSHLNLHGRLSTQGQAIAATQNLPTLKLDIKSQGVSVSLRGSQSHSPSGSVDKAVQPMAPVHPAMGKLIASEKASHYQTAGNTHPSNKSTGTGTLERQATLKSLGKDGDRQSQESISGKQASSSSKTKERKTPSSGSVTPDLSSSS
ncbi:ral GTPase-activating protein subunit alpha-1-like isoform X4 [Apostichopus japonicus]|uniref:ral GTPase-activating protein subunit alpha-1-like isoform X4 n=1 Tax=Stichopus japonicus TaxID=307972 RepID=UPI003AB668BE